MDDKEKYTKEINEETQRFDKPTLTDEEKREADQRYELWCKNSKLNDDVLQNFMADKLAHMHQVMEKSDSIRSWHGSIRPKEAAPDKKTEKCDKDDIKELKDEIAELKQLIVEKLK